MKIMTTILATTALLASASAFAGADMNGIDSLNYMTPMGKLWGDLSFSKPFFNSAETTTPASNNAGGNDIFQHATWSNLNLEYGLMDNMTLGLGIGYLWRASDTDQNNTTYVAHGFTNPEIDLTYRYWKMEGWTADGTVMLTPNIVKANLRGDGTVLGSATGYVTGGAFEGGSTNFDIDTKVTHSMDNCQVALMPKLTFVGAGTFSNTTTNTGTATTTETDVTSNSYVVFDADLTYRHHMDAWFAEIGGDFVAPYSLNFQAGATNVTANGSTTNTPASSSPTVTTNSIPFHVAPEITIGYKVDANFLVTLSGTYQSYSYTSQQAVNGSNKGQSTSTAYKTVNGALNLAYQF